MKRTRNTQKNRKQAAPVKKKPEAKITGRQTTDNSKKCLPAALIAGILLFSLNYFFVFSPEPVFITDNAYRLSFIISSMVVVLTAIGICYGYSKVFKLVLKYTFGFLLIYQLIPQIIVFTQLSQAQTDLIIALVFLQKTLIIPLSGLGILLLWLNRNDISIRTDESPEHHFSFKKLFRKPDKKHLIVSILFIFILSIAGGAVFHKLDNFNLYSDEAQVTHAAVGFAKSGEFKKWNFVKDEITDRSYTRAWPHIAVMGYTYRAFGISDWTSRLPSAVFGLLLTILGFFVARFFTKSTITALTVMFAFGLYFEFLLLTRWARMYAMIFPLFLLMMYVGYRIFTEPISKKKNLSGKFGHFFDNYLNFNYKLLPIFFILLFLNISLHNNTAIALPILFLFIVFSGIIHREKKYIIPVLAGVLIIVTHILSPFLFGYGHITAFEMDNSDIYNRFFLGFPFNVQAGMTLLLLGTGYFFFRKNKPLNNAYILLYAATVFSWILFAYVIDFSISFRYMSMVAPLCVILFIGIFLQIIKDIYGKPLQYPAALLIAGLVILNLSMRADDLYVRNFASPADPATAWKKIIKNYKKGEVVFKHWGPMLYFDQIDESATIRTIGSGKKYQMPLNELLDSLNNYPGGWLTWHTHHQNKLHKDIPLYCTRYFEKYAGYGIDTLGVEIYHYKKEMLKDSSVFQLDKLFPAGNINFEKDFSVSFGINFPSETKASPFLFTVYGEDIYNISADKAEISVNYLQGKKTNITGKLNPVQVYNHIVVFQKGSKAGIMVNGKTVTEKRIKKKINDVVKFTINKAFRGDINDIRIYDFAINEAQAKIIISSFNLPKTDELVVNGKAFKALFHWQKKQ